MIVLCVAAVPTASSDEIVTSERESASVTVAANDAVMSSASLPSGDDGVSTKTSTLSSQLQITEDVSSSHVTLTTITSNAQQAQNEVTAGQTSQNEKMSETTTSGRTAATTTTHQEMTETKTTTTETDPANTHESPTNVLTSQQTPTSEQTSSGLTTDAQSTLTSSPSPDVHCCCRCCFPSTQTCKVCDGDSLTDASECANEKPKTVDRSTPKFEPPSALDGSKHPERLAYREDFLKSEQLTETLAALPESQKIELGFKSSDLIVDCLYDGSPCFIEQLVQMSDSFRYGNCLSVFVVLCFLECFDAVSWVTGRAAGLKKPVAAIPKEFPLNCPLC